MLKFLIVISVLLFYGCNESNKTKTCEIVNQCVVDSVVYKGRHSTIEPDIYWYVYTDCGINFPVRYPCKYKKGDTITTKKIIFDETKGF